MTSKGLTPRIFIFLLLADVIQFVLILSLKRISETITAPTLESLSLNWLWDTAVALSTLGYFWIILACMVASFIVWMTVLANLDLSLAFPLGSLSYVIIPLLSVSFLNEDIPLLRWLGICIIICGILTLSMGNKPERKQHHV